MTEPTNLPPAPRAGGCCGMGCLTVMALLIFLGFAFVGGGLWAVHHLGRKYSSPEPSTLPEVITLDAPASVESPALERASPTQPSAAPVQSRPVETRWKAFERAADRNEKAQIELTAGEINALLQNNRNTRGKVFVSIENNVGRVRFSVPLKDVPLMRDRYVNGEASVEASPDGDPAKARITNITLANNSVPDAIVDQHMFGWPSLRGLIADWLSDQEIASFRIENNRVLGETRGR